MSIKPLILLSLTLIVHQASTARPNIILCMADDLGWGDVGFNGNTVIRTPHLDEMARHSLRFDRFYAAAPVCSPTRGSAVTGRHPYRYGVFFANTGHLRPQEWNLAEMVRQHRYATGHFGKWHLGTLTKNVRDANRGGPQGVAHFAPPWQHGFDVCFSTESKVPTWDPLLKPTGQVRKTWWDPVTPESGSEFYGTAYWNQKGQSVTENTAGDDSRVIMDRAVQFIQQMAADDQPFLAVVWFHAPHLPVVAGPRYTALYSRHEKYEQHYYGCVTALDEQMGRLRKTLRETGVADNTMLWFCSDNGPEGQTGKAPGTAGPLRGRKRSLYEGGIRVPGLLEWPAAISSGRSTASPACTLDYLPTVMDILGIEQPEVAPLDGVSLLPLIQGQTDTRARPIAFESRNQVAVIDERFKLIHLETRANSKSVADRSQLERVQLYDLVDDPSETQDVSDRHPEVVNRLRQLALDWRASCRASLAGADYENTGQP